MLANPIPTPHGSAPFLCDGIDCRSMLIDNTKLPMAGSLRTSEVRCTVSPSMDVMLPYNAWRLLYVASGGDGASVRQWQKELTGELTHFVRWLCRGRSGMHTI